MSRSANRIPSAQIFTTNRPGLKFWEQVDTALQLARRYPDELYDVVERLEDAQTAPNNVDMEFALVRAHAGLKRHWSDTETDMSQLMSGRDFRRRDMVTIQEILGGLLVERFGESFYGDPPSAHGAWSTVWAFILVTTGLVVLYFRS